MRDRHHDCWRDVPAIPGAILINSGACMHALTGGKLQSTLHRVVATPTPSPAPQSPAQAASPGVASRGRISADETVPKSGLQPSLSPLELAMLSRQQRAGTGEFTEQAGRRVSARSHTAAGGSMDAASTQRAGGARQSAVFFLMPNRETGPLIGIEPSTPTIMYCCSAKLTVPSFRPATPRC